MNLKLLVLKSPSLQAKCSKSNYQRSQYSKHIQNIQSQKGGSLDYKSTNLQCPQHEKMYILWEPILRVLFSDGGNMARQLGV